LFDFPSHFKGVTTLDPNQEQTLLDRLTSQGVNAENIFTSIGPAIYALTHRDGGYARMSDFCTTLAAAEIGGLEASDVLDMGCGYGTTTMSVAAWLPRSITALDNSPAMLSFMRKILQSDENLDAWLHTIGAAQVLGEIGLYEPLLQHFEKMRDAYMGGLFHQLGTLELVERDILELDTDGKPYDAIIGNNMFHWPVNQRVAKLAEGSNRPRVDLVLEAVADTLRPLKHRLHKDGTVVLMEPADFISLDDDPDMDSYIERNAMQAHPLFNRVQNAANEILLREYDIKRPAAKRTTLLKKSELSSVLEKNGYHLSGFHHVQAAYVNDPREIFLSRLPMHIGNVKEISFAAKLRILREVHEQLKSPLTVEERQPVRPHWFFLVLQPL
jgi:SAM-dependent methyltransferase